MDTNSGDVELGPLPDVSVIENSVNDKKVSLFFAKSEALIPLISKSDRVKKIVVS